MYINEKQNQLITNLNNSTESTQIVEPAMDMGMYASHGTFIRKLKDGGLKKFAKPKAAIINPIPNTIPREKRKHIKQDQSIKLNSKTYNSIFKFQSLPQTKKPLENDLIQPFLYIQKVIKKQTVDHVNQKRGKLKNFVVPSIVKKSQFPTKVQLNVPKGYNNLFEYQQQKRNAATYLFDKMNQIDIGDLKQSYSLWNGNKNKTKDLNVKEQEFINFMNQVLPNKVSKKTLKAFFQLYKNKKDTKNKKLEAIANAPDQISIRILAFNYEKFKKSQNEVINILSQKALKQRFTYLNLYNQDFDQSYHKLKDAMKQVKNYQQNLRKHFQQIYESYRNPYEQQIKELKTQLQKPIIKYDKKKKQQLTGKIEQLQNANAEIQERLAHDYQNFLDSYQKSIVPNHDLFFTKRTTNKLILPVLKSHPKINRRMIQQRIQQQQKLKQRYLQCLSDLVVQMDNDKRMLGQDVFTLGEFINMILLREKGSKKVRKIPLTTNQPIQFIIKCSKKLVKQIKRQYLLKNNLQVQKLDDFPADQQIPMQILHKCFEMQCTKVLLKNQIWTQLINLIPTQNQQSRLHQATIDANVCMEFLKKYFIRLDNRIKIQLRKSKQVSLLAQNASLQNFGTYGQILDRVALQIDNYIQNPDQQQKQVQTQKKKKITFLDVITQNVQKANHPQEYAQKKAQENHKEDLIKSIIKAVYNPSYVAQVQGQQHQNYDHQSIDIPQNLSLLKTLAKSSFFNQSINTNAFDIRFYEKMEKNNQNNSVIDQAQMEESVVRMGKSILLSNLPPVQNLPVPQTDPLRISRFLLTNLDQGYKQTKKIVKNKTLDKNIKEGVSHNYYRQKLKLQNKPTVFDCQGKSKYSVLLPVAYYQGMLQQMKSDKQKWFLRPHHVQTLTQNPLSKKDNLIKTEYMSKMDKIPLKKRPQQFVIQQNVKRKQGLIGSLQQRLNSLKQQLMIQKNKPKNIQSGAFIKAQQVDKYLINITNGKQDKQLQLGAFEAILYDLRKKERQILTDYRGQQDFRRGQPDEKWWQRKDSGFNRQLKKDRLLVSETLRGEDKHRQYVTKLKNGQLY